MWILERTCRDHSAHPSSMHVALCGNHVCHSRVKVHKQPHLKSARCLADHGNPSPLQASPVPPQLLSLNQKRLAQLNGVAALSWLAAGEASLGFAADTVSAGQPYVPSPVNIGWEVYAGAIAGVIPFAIGSYQFVARILIQRRCPRCSGSGLIERGPFLRKCPECGGFFPWQGWKQFLTSTAAPGNGGVLRQPRDQNGVIYRIPPKTKDETPK